MNRILAAGLGVLAMAGWTTMARGEALFEYWTELQAVNLTSNDIKITKVDWHGHLDDSTAHVSASHSHGAHLGSYHALPRPSQAATDTETAIAPARPGQ